MTSSLRARVLAPAKINLGLEILGRREDGFHEVRSILAMVDLNDEIQISDATDTDHSSLDGVPGVAVEDNLIMRAISRFSEHTGQEGVYNIRVVKRIPAPAGLGSASSNAAATLLALNAMRGSPVDADTLHALASKLGSDVPFFLGTPVALVSGRGTDLTPLRSVPGWVLIVVPRIELQGKTAKLYSMLSAEDFTEGSHVWEIARDIAAGQHVRQEMLHNAFERPLREIAPATSRITEQMLSAGCSHVALSGAGPAHYSLFDSHVIAQQVEARLLSIVDSSVMIAVAPFATEPISVELS